MTNSPNSLRHFPSRPRNGDPVDRDVVGMLQADVVSVACTVIGVLNTQAARGSVPAGGIPGMLLSLALCAVAICFGWGLLVAGLLYVLVDYGATVWLLATLGVALGHGVLAIYFWRSAAKLGRRLITPAAKLGPEE
jgi:hypothetical protein